MKKLLSVFALAAAALSAAEPGLLLHAGFDKKTTVPDFVQNPKTQTKGVGPELGQRLCQGPDGKLEAVCLDNRQFVEYTHTGNFDPRRGTVSFWVKPVNWKMSAVGHFQTFFEVRSGDSKYRLIVNKDMSRDQLCFTIVNGKWRGTVYFAPTRWGTDRWHKIDCTWDARGMKLYVDGETPKPGSTREKIFEEDPKFPESIRWASMRINFFSGWKVDPDWQTAYDELKIYDRVLSPEEIRAGYEKVFPGNGK